MSNFLLLYHGGSRPEDPAEQAKVMTAWTEWFGKLGDALVDGGNPASQTRQIAADGGVTTVNGGAPTGYSIIKATDMDSAVALAKGCPVLAGGASLQVAEIMDAM
ncbi:MAG: hypothetical protein QOJ81_1126 [Chloroflexota bacterium]|jgi:hypothetical protein|nr:hypothetical protein [Chloroflexota bacterium]